MAETLTVEEAIEQLNSIDVFDPEGAHVEADDILFQLAPLEVQQAYDRVTERASWWAYA